MAVDPSGRKWLIMVGPDGITCGGCRRTIIGRRPSDTAINTCVDLIERSVEHHLKSCVRVLEYNARAAAQALETNACT